jgi:glutaconate CoA-transferase subunit B
MWRFDESGGMRLDFMHPGATVDEVRATVAWEPKISPNLAPTPAPTPEELRLVREELDPGGVYTK